MTIYYDIVFPECASYGSTQVPVYLTDKVEVESGAEYRNTRRIYPRHEYTVNMDNMNAVEIAEIMNIWHVCAGDFIGFLFKDPLDHTSKNDDGTALGGTETGASDQVVTSSAVGTQASYGLYKKYYAGTNGQRTKSRRILYPEEGSIQIAVNGFDIFDWTYSYSTGLLTFSQPILETTASLSRDGSGVISGHDFSDLQEGSLIYIEDWPNAAYNAGRGGNPARVATLVNGGADGIILEDFDGNAYGSDTFTDESITFLSALPPSGCEITAGYYFYVPVRFAEGDTMEGEITAGLRESAFASFSSIRLREIYE